MIKNGLLVILVYAGAAFAVFGNIGNAIAQQSAADRCQRESGDAAIAACDQAIIQNPRNAELWFFRGYERANKGDHDRAIADYNEAIRLDPRFARAYFNMGNRWADKGDHDRAIVNYNEAIRLDPKYAHAYNNRGNSYEKKSELGLALSDFRSFNRLAPNDPTGPASIARIEGRLNDFAARPEQQSAQALKPPQFSPSMGQAPPSLPTAGPAANSFFPEARRVRTVAVSPDGAIVQRSGEGLDIAAVNTRRVALVIGNTRYQHAARLVNPTNDADLMAAAFRAVGFQSVVVQKDLTQPQLLQTLREFSALADNADWAVVYYSGHGIEFGGANYLIPVEARLRSDRDIDLEGVDVGKVLSSIEGAKRLRLVILDACRDNPFASQMRRTMASRSLGRGLARIEPEAGTLIAYAAKHGEVALDGDGKNSPYALALAKRLQQRPALEVRRLFDVVRDDVVVATSRKQQPFSYGSVSGSEDFFFAAGNENRIEQASNSNPISSSVRGGFAVQLGAPGSLSEAEGLVVRINKQYEQALGGYKPSIRAVEVDQRDVFRVRVINLSQEEASGLCDTLKRNGGNCFVARD